MMLASVGVPLMPAGGSFCSLLKSRMRRLRAGVLMAPTSLALSSFLRRLKKAPDCAWTVVLWRTHSRSRRRSPLELEAL